MLILISPWRLHPSFGNEAKNIFKISNMSKNKVVLLPSPPPSSDRNLCPSLIVFVYLFPPIWLYCSMNSLEFWVRLFWWRKKLVAESRLDLSRGSNPVLVLILNTRILGPKIILKIKPNSFLLTYIIIKKEYFKYFNWDLRRITKRYVPDPVLCSGSGKSEPGSATPAWMS